MSYFAEIEKGIVKRIIVADQEFINSGAVGDSNNWVETKEDNYTGIGHTYDQNKKEFIRPTTIKMTQEEIMAVESQLKANK